MEMNSNRSRVPGVPYRILLFLFISKRFFKPRIALEEPTICLNPSHPNKPASSWLVIQSGSLRSLVLILQSITFLHSHRIFLSLFVLHSHQDWNKRRKTLGEILMNGPPLCKAGKLWSIFEATTYVTRDLHIIRLSQKNVPLSVS